MIQFAVIVFALTLVLSEYRFDKVLGILLLAWIIWNGVKK